MPEHHAQWLGRPPVWSGWKRSVLALMCSRWPRPLPPPSPGRGLVGCWAGGLALDRPALVDVGLQRLAELRSVLLRQVDLVLLVAQAVRDCLVRLRPVQVIYKRYLLCHDWPASLLPAGSPGQYTY